TALMGRAMALPGEDFDSFYQATVALLDELEIPRDLGALGVAEERAAEIARKAHGDAARATNPVPATVAQIESLLREAIHKAR
ncbi:MAG: iron-containing alcohol dehydrogenase, partial [Rhodospirillales bacterium]|nr:iron-containing alcohol dehydrogenase [Rhodospirillales bacterium]